MREATRNKGYYTQWATQFYVAAELTRRGYLVSLTLGTAPDTDLLVVSPSGKHFKVDVKGLRRLNWWILGRPEPQKDLFYVLVYVPDDVQQPPKFFVMICREAEDEIEKHIEELKLKGREVTELEYGFSWKTAFKYENQWDKLPK